MWSRSCRITESKELTNNIKSLITCMKFQSSKLPKLNNKHIHAIWIQNLTFLTSICQKYLYEPWTCTKNIILINMLPKSLTHKQKHKHWGSMNGQATWTLPLSFHMVIPSSNLLAIGCYFPYLFLPSFPFTFYYIQSLLDLNSISP